MSAEGDSLGSAHRRAYVIGLVFSFSTPGLMAGLMLSGVVPPGPRVPEGIYLQLGYLFTGLVFLSAAWVLWRSGRVLSGFRALPEARRPGVILRECLIYAAVFECSSFLGLAYWSLVGIHAARHAWAFVLLPPMLFLALTPRLSRWMLALENAGK